MAKYNIKLNDLEAVGGIKKLESDGFSRSEIMQAVHQQTDQGLNRDRTQQRQLVDNLFDRTKTD